MGLFTASDYTLIELAAGTAALSLYCLGEVEPAITYMGGKRWHAPEIAYRFHLGRPDRIILNDPGPWGKAWPVLVRPHLALQVAAKLDEWAPQVDINLWTDLRLQEPRDPVEWTAGFLFLQARTFNGKPTSYSHPMGSFDPEFRHRGPARRKPSWANPRPALAARVRILARLPWPDVAAFQAPGNALAPFRLEGKRIVVYIDPPYVGTEGYANAWPRQDVIAVALAWAKFGALVLISEGEPIPIPGWDAVELRRRAGGPIQAGARTRREYITFTPNRGLDMAA